MKSISAITLLALTSSASGCLMNYTNTADVPVTICMRNNGNAPGQSGNKTLAKGESWVVGCRASVPGQSWESYFAVPGWSTCGWDQGCNPNTGTCKHYPWSVGQGVGTNGLWYGAIGANWDGAGVGFTGGFDKVPYGLHFKCNAYNNTQHPDLKCGVHSGTPYCTPNKPNYGQPNSGVVECDPDQTLSMTIFSS